MAKVKEKEGVAPIEGKNLKMILPGTLLRSVAHKDGVTEVNLYFIKTNDEDYPLIELEKGVFYDIRTSKDYIFIIVQGQLTLQN